MAISIVLCWSSWRAKFWHKRSGISFVEIQNEKPFHEANSKYWCHSQLRRCSRRRTNFALSDNLLQLSVSAERLAAFLAMFGVRHEGGVRQPQVCCVLSFHEVSYPLAMQPENCSDQWFCRRKTEQRLELSDTLKLILSSLIARQVPNMDAVMIDIGCAVEYGIKIVFHQPVLCTFWGGMGLLIVALSASLSYFLVIVDQPGKNYNADVMEVLRKRICLSKEDRMMKMLGLSFFISDGEKCWYNYWQVS